MPDLYTLFAKIQSLPKGRIAQVEDFVDFLTLRRVGKASPPPLTLEEKMQRLEEKGPSLSFPSRPASTAHATSTCGNFGCLRATNRPLLRANSRHFSKGWNGQTP